MALSFQTNGLKGHMHKKLKKPHLWLAGHYSLYPKQPTIKMIVWELTHGMQDSGLPSKAFLSILMNMLRLSLSKSLPAC